MEISSFINARFEKSCS